MLSKFSVPVVSYHLQVAFSTASLFLHKIKYRKSEQITIIKELDQKKNQKINFLCRTVFTVWSVACGLYVWRRQQPCNNGTSETNLPMVIWIQSLENELIASQLYWPRRSKLLFHLLDFKFAILPLKSFEQSFKIIISNCVWKRNFLWQQKVENSKNE